jgi:hypothetical protein
MARRRAKKKAGSRKGAKAQRRRRQEQVTFNTFAFLLCAFARDDFLIARPL